MYYISDLKCQIKAVAIISTRFSNQSLIIIVFPLIFLHFIGFTLLGPKLFTWQADKKESPMGLDNPE